VGPFGVEAVEEVVEAGLLLQEVAAGGFGGLELQGQMHKLKNIGLNRTGINEVVGVFADCEGREPEGERALQSAVAALAKAGTMGVFGLWVIGITIRAIPTTNRLMA
jgi:hypothetical protein